MTACPGSSYPCVDATWCLVRIVIAGCGRVGSSLAQMFVEDGHDVTVIDMDQRILESLGKGFNGATVVGNAASVDVLAKAGIADADVFLATTDNDNVNLMAVEIAKAVYAVPRSIARLFDPAREASYRALNISFVTGTKLIAQVLFEQIIDEEFEYHVTFTEGDVEIVEFHLGPGGQGIEVGDLEVRNQLRVSCVRRGDVTHIPSTTFRLAEGDLVVAAARDGVRTRIARFLAAGNS